MKKLLAASLFAVLFSTNTHADCVSCWNLKYVKIILENNEEILGYVKWNRAWYANFEDPNLTIPESFPENMIEFYSRWQDGKAKIEVYNNVRKFGTNQEWASYFYLHDDRKLISFEMVKSIEKCENEVDNIPGAQELAVFNADILKYVDKEPLTVEMHDDGGCEYYFLNFNPGISKDKLATMISNGFWENEEDFASKLIFILKQCYD